jgi:predicted site-specific integrase-resolvase
MLMHKLETIAAGANHKVRLPLRQAVLDQEVYYVIKQSRERLGRAGSKKTYEAVHLDTYEINREECE